MTRPTIHSSTYTAFVDLTAAPDSITIFDGVVDQRHTVQVGLFDIGAHLTLHLAPGSLAALRDAITTHLESSP